MGLRTFFWRRVGAYPVMIRGERFVCHPRHFGRWRRTANEKWEGGTLDILDRNLSAESVLWDIGAHIGQVALYASRKCRRVVCFEPDAATLPYLHWNVSRNRADNVVVVGAAMAAGTDFRRMGGFWADGDLGGLAHSLHPSPTVKSTLTPCLGREAWGEWLRAEPPDFVKMNIEGGEYEVLPVMADWLEAKRPRLLLSLHGSALKQAGRMSASELASASESVASALSFYGKCLDLKTGESFPVSELAARTSAEDYEWEYGVFLE